jgi:hypothetical protein
MASFREVIEGLRIFIPYSEKGEEAHNIDAQHDVIYARPDYGKALTPEDEARLKELGWHFELEADSWARFV